MEGGSRTDAAGTNESERKCCASMQTAGEKRERTEPPPASNGAEPKVQQAESPENLASNGFKFSGVGGREEDIKERYVCVEPSFSHGSTPGVVSEVLKDPS